MRLPISGYLPAESEVWLTIKSGTLRTIKVEECPTARNHTKYSDLDSSRRRKAGYRINDIRLYWELANALTLYQHGFSIPGVPKLPDSHVQARTGEKVICTCLGCVIARADALINKARKSKLADAKLKALKKVTDDCELPHEFDTMWDVKKGVELAGVRDRDLARMLLAANGFDANEWYDRMSREHPLKEG